MSKTLNLAAGLLLASTATAFAHSNEARFAEQEAMIEQGRINGTITWREGRKLRREQRQIERVMAELKSDGYFSRADKRKVFRLQDIAEENIRCEVEDSWRRLSWAPRVGR